MATRRHLILFGFGLLLLYVLMGVADVPFHGDESTTLNMAKDWFRMRQHGFSALYYHPNPSEPYAQDLRLLNGTIPSLSYAIMLDLAGLNGEALNNIWHWGEDWWVNQYYGSFPRADVLFIGRWTSALTLCLALALFFASARLLVGIHRAFFAVLIIGLTPAVLLNGRRAVFEGATLLGLALVWYAAAQLVTGKVRLGNWLFFGAACGIALAAKHINLLLIMPTFAALLWYGRARLWQTLRATALSALVMSAVFLAFNPSWWVVPWFMPQEVLRLRTNMLAIQNTLLGRPLTIGERLEALVAFPLGVPQYFEEVSQPWYDWLAESIQGYERGFQGIAWYTLAPLVYVALIVGITTLPRLRTGAFIGITLLGMSVALLVTNTLMWQRYYLPLTFPLALLTTLGLTELAKLIRRALVARHV
ncbi:MAG: glycosyltransferase family 39 protein [Anaerolineae bacterium]|nr:glycosyltransferase family 39 protein [Anaerolineae bacterium]